MERRARADRIPLTGCEARAARTRLGLTLRAVAAEGRVPESRLCQWERHGDGLSLVGQHRVAAFLRLRLAEEREREALADLGRLVLEQR